MTITPDIHRFVAEAAPAALAAPYGRTLDTERRSGNGQPSPRGLSRYPLAGKEAKGGPTKGVGLVLSGGKPQNRNQGDAKLKKNLDDSRPRLREKGPYAHGAR